MFMRPGHWVLLLIITALVTAAVPVFLHTLSPYGVVAAISLLAIALLSYLAGLFTNRATRRAIGGLADLIQSGHAATIGLLRSYLLVVQMGQQQQAETLHRIERKVGGQDAATAPHSISDRRLREYLHSLRQRDAVRSEDLVGLIELLCDALAIDEDTLVVNGRCLVCDSADPTLLEHPLHVKQAHHPDCPLPDRARLTQEVRSVIFDPTTALPREEV